MADELPVGEYSIEPRKYVIAVKLSSKVFNHLQKGARNTTICFGKENNNNIFTVDNEQYNFSVVQQEEEEKGLQRMVQDCYYQSGDLFAEIGDVKKKLLFTQELTGEDRNRIKHATTQAEKISKERRVIVMGGDASKIKKGVKGSTKRYTKIGVAPKVNRLVVPSPAARNTTPPRPSTPPLINKTTPNTTTPPQNTSSLSPPLTPSTPPLVSPPQHTQPPQKVLSPPLGSPPPTTPPTAPPVSRVKSAARSRSSLIATPPAPTPPPPPVIKETPPKPPQKVSLRTQLIHDLALDPKTVAKLVEKRKATAEEIKQLLPTIAKYQPPGLWHPIPEIFREVVLDWHEYSPEDRQVVSEKVQEALAKLASEPSIPAPVEDKTNTVDRTKNLKDVITLDPSERRPPRIPPPSSSGTSTSPTLDLASPPTSGSTKKRPRDAAKPTNLNPPIPSELLSPPPPLAATAPTPAVATSPSLPSPPLVPPPTAPTPTTTPVQKRTKPPPKPPSNPIPLPISNPSSSSSTSSKSSTTPTNKTNPVKPKSVTPPTKSVPTAPPSKSAVPTPPSKVVPKTTPPSKPPPLPSKQHATGRTTTKTTLKNIAPSSSSSSSSAPARATNIPPMRTPEVPTFNINITNQQENDKYRRTYHEKYGTYRELHQKLTENRDLFLKFDDEWRGSDQEGRSALSSKIESAYFERREEVEKMQEQHAVLHAELSAIKDAMRKYTESVRTQRTQEPRAQKEEPSTKKPKLDSSPPLQQQRANNNNNNNNSHPKPAPSRPKPPLQKQNSVSTKL